MTTLYDRDGVSVLHGNCLDVLPTLGPVAHVITDPPFADATHAGARTTRPGIGPLPIITFDSFDDAAVAEAFALCGALVQRWLISSLDWRHMLALEQSPPAGLRFVRFGVWHKPNGAPQFTGDRPATGWEALAFLHKAGGAMRWNGGGRSSVFTHCKVNSEHPTGKPLALMLELVALFTDPGDLVLDPFCGSGTTLVACAMLGRRAIGIEFDAGYAAIAAKRLEGVTAPMPGLIEAVERQGAMGI